MNKKGLYESIMRQVSKEVKKALNENSNKDNAIITGIKLKKDSFYINLSNDDSIDDDDVYFDENNVVYWQAKVEPCEIKVYNQKIWINRGVVYGFFYQDDSADYMMSNIDDDYNCELDYIEEGKTILNDFYGNNDLDIMFDKFNVNLRKTSDTLIIGDKSNIDCNLSKDFTNVYYIELHGGDISNIY